MKHKLVSKRLSAIALGTILATSPLSIVANAQTEYKGQKPLTITINQDATIGENLDLLVSDSNEPSVTFAGAGSMTGKLTFEGNDLFITATQGAGEVEVTNAAKVEIEKAESVTIELATDDVVIGEVSAAVGVVDAGKVSITKAGGDVTITKATDVVVEEAVNIEVTEADSVEVTKADSVEMKSDVASLEIKGDITGTVTVDGSAVTIGTGASIGEVTNSEGVVTASGLTGTVGTLVVNAAITINAELTDETTINANVILGDDTTVTEDAEITVNSTSENPVSVEISSEVTIERKETTTGTGEDAVTTSEPLFATGSTISSLTTATSVELGDATVTDAFEVVVPAEGEISVTGGTIEAGADLTFDLSNVGDDSTIAVTLPDSVKDNFADEDGKVEINYTTSDGSTFDDSNLTVKTESMTEEESLTVDLVQQATPPTLIGEDAPFGGTISVDFSGIVYDEDTGAATQYIHYTTDGSSPLATGVDGEGNTTLQSIAGRAPIMTDQTFEFTGLDEVKICAVVAQYDITAETPVVQRIKPSKEVTLTLVVKEADYSGLQEAIDEAEDLLADTKTSQTEGADIDPSEKWVTLNQYEAFSDVIKAAQQAILDKEETTQGQIDDLVDVLFDEIDEFDLLRADGTKVETPEDEKEPEDENSDETHTISLVISHDNDVDFDITTSTLKFKETATSENADVAITATLTALDEIKKELVATVEENLENNDDPLLDDSDGITEADLVWTLSADLVGLLTLTEAESADENEDQTEQSLLEATEAITGGDVKLALITLAENEAAEGTLTAKIEDEAGKVLASTTLNIEIAAAVEEVVVVEPTKIILTAKEYESENNEAILDEDSTETETESPDLVWTVEAGASYSIAVTAKFNEESTVDISKITGLTLTVPDSFDGGSITIIVPDYFLDEDREDITVTIPDDVDVNPDSVSEFQSLFTLLETADGVDENEMVDMTICFAGTTAESDSGEFVLTFEYTDSEGEKISATFVLVILADENSPNEEDPLDGDK